MARLPRFVPQLALACSFVTVPLMRANFAAAQAAPAESAPAAPADAAPAAPADAAPAPAAAPAATEAAPASPELIENVEDFWHYGKIARYDLAKAEADKIVAQKDNPQAVLEAFEKVTTQRKDSLDEWLLP